MAILNYFKQNKLNEELHIDGLTFIGKGFGWEVYQATTFAGVQQLKTGDTELGAGTGWCTPRTQEEPDDVAAERIFNTHIVQRQTKMYFFVKEGTNKAYYAAIAVPSGGNVLKTPKGFRIRFQNYQIQNESGSDERQETNSTSELPLFLLPDIKYNGQDGVLIYDGRVAEGTYNGLIDPNNIPAETRIKVERVKSNVFTDYCVPVVILEQEVSYVENNAFRNYTGQIKCAAEKPEDVSWSSEWNGNNTNIVWGIYLTPEEIARREEAERQRQEEERRLRELQIQDAISVLRYRIEGKGVTILGVKRRREDIEIPAEIEGKPVTKIAPFAFYNNVDLDNVIVPDTVKEIGKAAFYGCSNATVSYPSDAVVLKDAFAGCYSFDPR